jgi:HlyD family secretion protein
MAIMTTKKTNLFSNKAIRIVIAVSVVAVLAGGGYFGYKRFTASKTTATAETLFSAKATTGNMELLANGTGTILPAGESTFGFSSSGQVSQINVKVGDQVKAGDVLAQLDDTDAKIALTQAQEAMDKLTSAAAIATARADLATAETNLASAKSALEYLISPDVLYWEEQVGQRQQVLTDAQTATQTDTSAAAKQKVTDAQTSLKYAQDSLSYFQTVYRKDYVAATFTQYRTFNFRGRTITEPVTTEDKHGKKHNVIIPPTDAEIGVARADYEAAKATIAEAQTYLDVLNGAEIPEGATGANLVTYLQTRHALETAQYNLNATRLIAPINGTVTALNVSVGDLAGGSSAITISNLEQPYALDAYLDAKDWGQVRVGYEVEVTFDIIPDQSFAGVVTTVYPTLDTTSSQGKTLIHIAAILDNKISYDLPAGSAASVDVVGGRAKNAVLVPVEALHEFEDGKYSLFVMQNGKLRLRVVNVGIQDLTQAEIISGLKAGEVVTTGLIETK